MISFYLCRILTVKHAYAQRQSMSSKVPLYSVSSNPSQSYQFIVAGKDQYVRLYDKRMLAEGKTKVLKMFTPSNLVRLSFLCAKK